MNDSVLLMENTTGYVDRFCVCLYYKFYVDWYSKRTVQRQFCLDRNKSCFRSGFY